MRATEPLSWKTKGMWEVREGQRLRRFNAEMVRSMIGHGSLSGVEWVRVEGGSWQRLHETQMFWDALPGGLDPRQRAILRASWPLVAHAVLFVVVVAVFPLLTIIPVIWLLVLGVHTRAQASHITDAMQLPSSRPAKLSRSEPDADVPELVRMIAALSDALPEDGEGMRTELDAMAGFAKELSRRITSLTSLVTPTDGEALQRQKVEVERRLDSTLDARTRQVMARELQSLEERQDALREADAELTRLRAEERAITHQVEGLRLTLARRGGEIERADLLSEIKMLRDRMRAEAEIDAALDAGRRGPHPF